MSGTPERYIQQQQTSVVAILFTRQDLIDRAREYVRQNSQGVSRVDQMVLFGHMVDFLSELFPPAKS